MSTATASELSTTGSSPPRDSCPASRLAIPQPLATLASTIAAGPRPVTSNGTSISTAGASSGREDGSEDGEGVDRAAGDALEADRGQGELELPTVEAVAGGGQVLEVAVVDEPQAHGDDADH